MAVQVFAGLMNVALDYVFVILLGMGTAGAAAATVVSQVSAFLLVLGFFLKRENRIAVADLRPDRHIALHALRLGLAPFGLTLLPEATVVAINVNLSMYGGEQALAAYAVVSYTACVIQMLIQGVGDGSQPLISKHYGAGDADGVRRFRNTNYLITISLGVYLYKDGRRPGRRVRGAAATGGQAVSVGRVAGVPLRRGARGVLAVPADHAQSGRVVHRHGRRGHRYVPGAHVPAGDVRNAEVEAVELRQHRRAVQTVLSPVHRAVPVCVHRQHAEVRHGGRAELRQPAVLQRAVLPRAGHSADRRVHLQAPARAHGERLGPIRRNASGST